MTDFTPHHALFTGRRATAIIMAFFGVIIAVNALMVTLAVKNFGGLVVGNSYVASQTFDEDIAAARSQAIRGWTLDLSAGSGAVALQARDRDGNALTGLGIALTFDRPTHERSTVSLELAESGPGIYSAGAVLEPGRWIATVETADGQTRSLDFIHLVGMTP